MPASGTLYYSHDLDPRVAVAVARHLDALLRFVRVEPMGRDREMFRPINPSTRVPVLVEPGLALWETGAIAMRLAARHAPAFRPPERREEVMMRVGWSAHHFTHWAGGLYFERIVVPRDVARGPDEARGAAAEAGLAPFAAVLDAAPGRAGVAGGRGADLRRFPRGLGAARCRAGPDPAGGVRERARLACAAGADEGLVRSLRRAGLDTQGRAQASISPSSNGPIFCLSRRPSAETRIE